MQDNKNRFNNEAFLNEAWAKMELDLDREMPVKKKRRRVVFWWWWSGAAIVLGAFAFGWLLTNEGNNNNTTTNTPLVAVTTSGDDKEETTTTQQQHNSITNNRNIDNKNTFTRNNTDVLDTNPVEPVKNTTRLTTDREKNNAPQTITITKEKGENNHQAPHGEKEVNDYIDYTTVDINTSITPIDEEETMAMKLPTLAAEVVLTKKGEEDVNVGEAPSLSKKEIKRQTKELKWILLTNKKIVSLDLADAIYLGVGRVRKIDDFPLTWISALYWRQKVNYFSLDSYRRGEQDASNVNGGVSFNHFLVTSNITSKEVGMSLNLLWDINSRWSIGGTMDLGYDYKIDIVGGNTKEALGLADDEDIATYPTYPSNESLNAKSYFSITNQKRVFAPNKVEKGFELSPWQFNTGGFVQYRLDRSFTARLGFQYRRNTLLIARDRNPVKASPYSMHFGFNYQF